MSSLIPNENPYARFTTPDDAPYNAQCKGCLMGFDRDDLSRGGYCRACIMNQNIPYTCENCQHDWEQMGIADECPNCWSPRISSDDRFIDALIEEKQRYMAKTFHKHFLFDSILVAASVVATYSMF